MKKILKQIVPKLIHKKVQNWNKRALMHFLTGDKVLCPVCNSSFEKFATFGVDQRTNALCPSCDSLERHRLLWLYLKAKTNLFESENQIKLLHFAPEESLFKVLSATQNIQYIPCDYSPNDFKFDKLKSIIQVDITCIPFEENQFDVILCNHVLEHIIDDNLAMTELHRVIKHDGWGIFQVPINLNLSTTFEDSAINSKNERKIAFGQEDHVRIYGKDYKGRLENVGFHVVEDEYSKSFSNADLFKYGIDPSETIYYCKKR